MKTNALKIGLGVMALSLIGTIYSFAIDKDKTKQTKTYEVIRSVNGAISTHDTIIDFTSNYTPDNYLADLGFSKDPNIEIIDLLNFGTELSLKSHNCLGKSQAQVLCFLLDSAQSGEKMEDTDQQKMWIMQQEINSVMSHNKDDIISIFGSSEKLNDSNFDSIVNLISSGVTETLIETNLFKNLGDSILSQINVHQMESNGDIDSFMAIIAKDINLDDEINIIQEMFVIDGLDSSSQDFQHLKMKFEEMELNGNDFTNQFGDENHQIKVKVIGDNTDYTILLVKDSKKNNPSTSKEIQHKKISDLKLYPNPANGTAHLEYNFSADAPTTIVVNDINGKEVYAKNLGSLSGFQTHDFSLENWTNGVYIVTILHGDEKINEKLIVE